MATLPIDINDYLETARPQQIPRFIFSFDELQAGEFEADKPKEIGTHDETENTGLIAVQTDKELDSDLLKTANLIREISLGPALTEEEKKAWIAKFERVVLEKTNPLTNQETPADKSPESEVSVTTIANQANQESGSGQMPPKKPTQNGSLAEGDQAENGKKPEPEWDVFKVDKITGIALNVLRSRFKIAREIVSNAFNQPLESPKKVAQAETAKLDLFVIQEKGHQNSEVTVPPIAYKAQVALDFTKDDDILGMQKALNKTISNNEPKENVFPVEYQGRINQSGLDNDAQHLARKGAKNLILRKKRDWKPVGRLPFRNPFELKRVREKAA